jgi:hypothetical protein
MPVVCSTTGKLPAFREATSQSPEASCLNTPPGCAEALKVAAGTVERVEKGQRGSVVGQQMDVA